MRVRKVSGFFMAFMIAVSLTGLSYAHWSDTIKIEGTAKMAHIRIKIISYKALTSKEVENYSTIDTELSEDGHMLIIYCSNLKPCWHVWIGLVTQNEGSLPAYVKSPEYIFDGPDGFEDYFETMEYYYGPYSKDTGYGKLEVWGNVVVGEDLMENGTVTFTTPSETPPLETDPYEKVVIWIWIHVKNDTPDDIQGIEGTLYIRIVDDIAI